MKLGVRRATEPGHYDSPEHSCDFCERPPDAILRDVREFTAEQIDAIRHEAAVIALDALVSGLEEEFGFPKDEVFVSTEKVATWIKSVALNLRTHIPRTVETDLLEDR